jgi:hypothetical protein
MRRWILRDGTTDLEGLVLEDAYQDQSSSELFGKIVIDLASAIAVDVNFKAFNNDSSC